MQHTLTFIANDQVHTLLVDHGANLRKTLIDAGLSPYATVTRKANCGGRGLCATCGVWIKTTTDAQPQPDHWHDKIGSWFGYPRLSCQIAITEDLTVTMPDKWIWGLPEKSQRLR